MSCTLCCRLHSRRASRLVQYCGGVALMDGSRRGWYSSMAAAVGICVLVTVLMAMERAGAQILLPPPPAIPGVVVPGIPPPAAVVIPGILPPPPAVIVGGILPPPPALTIPGTTLLPPPPALVTTITSAPPPPQTVVVIGGNGPRLPFTRGFCSCRRSTSAGACTAFINACANNLSPQCGLANGVCTTGCACL
ncbi:hypothetical protein L7F22_067657 [Adiantum nelumboides]|nr:hypothetical protein [Adiantum nelumboides]